VDGQSTKVAVSAGGKCGRTLTFPSPSGTHSSILILATVRFLFYLDYVS
jgi:hypothetical protein